MPGGYACECGGKVATPVLSIYEMFAFVNQIVKYYFFYKIMHNYKIRFKFVKDFFIQINILAVFKGQMLKVILFSKINLFLCLFNDTGLDTHRFDKKNL